MTQITTEQGTEIARAVSSLAPAGSVWIVMLVDPEGQLATLSAIGPAATYRLLNGVVDQWSPESVDNVRAPL